MTSEPQADEMQVLQACGTLTKFPSDYLVLDVETTGFSAARDFIVDAGWAVVQNHRIVHQESLLLNWSLIPSVDHRLIRSQLERQAYEYSKVGRPHYYSWERLCDEGLHPVEALQAYAQLIADYVTQPGRMVVGHGLWRFDRQFIDGHTSQFLNDYLLPWERTKTVLDTGLIEKAMQIGKLPWADDTLDDWFKRVDATWSKCKWSLDSHCSRKYNLVERYGVDMRLAHTAGFDCQLTCFLLDTYRQLLEIVNGQRQILTGIEGSTIGRTGTTG